MVIPDFQSIMLPLLKLAGDGNEHSISEATETLAQHFGLSEEDRKEVLPSGKQRKFDNRVGWARSYLQKAHLLSHSGDQNSVSLNRVSKSCRMVLRISI